MRAAELRRGVVAVVVCSSVKHVAMRLIGWVRWLARWIPGRCVRWYGALAVESGVARPGRLV
jgi:hypothetical protein